MTVLELFGTLVGLIYLWLEYKASIYLWITGIIMPAIYIFVYYNAGLYADFGINIYYLLAAIYGWLYWTYGGKNKETNYLPITHAPTRIYLALLCTFVVFFIGIAWILIEFTDSNVPWLDSFTTALSIVGMWMLAKKYVEQWLSWILVDIVSSGLYIYKELYLTAGLYFIYTVIAVLGYMKWKKIMTHEQKMATSSSCS
ncbi:nicotinamide mononucleotide transporter PnuC [Bacteroides coprosuis DSM 18011]|uniref:Nicotinamide riboside transporter PnuC n=1 Tax=Bacteroides coprosuis DSM 18011 TaxID=679937 RepID=F3ZSC3_9BACE|nr:nicotinamide riboside transporter PnuC [Bacteroides coprosuis]EGJ70860.1 nicotinamide mononucleotide transporter PnuC [Bacteroides coprosuis DSM 18011]